MSKAIITSSHLWESSSKVGLHFFGEHLLKRGFDIFWLTIPFSFLSLLKPINFKEKLKKLKIVLKKGEKYKIYEKDLINFLVLSAFHPVKGVPFLEGNFVAKNYLKFSFPLLSFLLARYDFLKNQILLFDAGGICGWPYFKSKSKLKIYRLNDLILGFKGQSKGKINLEREIIKKADLILAVTESLLEYAFKIRGSKEGIYLLPNGVEIERYKKDYPLPSEYQNIPAPRAVFVGAVMYWFYWELVIEVAKKLKNVSFVIIGPGQVPERIPPNIYFLGPKPYQKIPAYLQHSDLGLIPFRNLPVIEKMEKPLKFYEYLAAGLPVVSTSFGQLKKMAPYAIFGNNFQEFSKGIEKALEYSKEEREKLKEVAKQFSWNKIFEDFDRILTEYGHLS